VEGSVEQVPRKIFESKRERVFGGWKKKSVEYL
jgi:hypothetical protein